jgi:hypothetical protein
MSFPVVRRPRPAYPAPPEIEHLPFELFRNALVTRDPEVIEAALESFEEQEAARETYEGPSTPYALPQKMQFQQWKTPPMTGFASRPDHGDPYAPAASLMLVRADQIERERDLIRANNPEMYPIERASFDRRMSNAYAPVDTRPLAMRDVPADGRPIYPYPWESVTHQVLDEDEELGPYTQGIQYSLQEVRATQDRFRNLLISNVRGRR